MFSKLGLSSEQKRFMESVQNHLNQGQFRISEGRTSTPDLGSLTINNFNNNQNMELKIFYIVQRERYIVYEIFIKNPQSKTNKVMNLSSYALESYFNDFLQKQNPSIF